MKTSIFIKSWHRDFPWLQYAKKSIQKFVSGIHEIVLCLPEGGAFDWTEARIVHVQEREPTYLNQQCLKLYSDILCDGDIIWHHDSDCIFTRPVTPQTFMRDGKVIWPYTPFAYSTDQERNVWQPVISKFMNEPAEASFMTRHDFLTPVWLLKELRNYCVQMHRQSLSDYIMAQASSTSMLTFSEFNCAGAYAYKYHRDKFVWLNTVQDEIPPKTIFQGFTHGGEERMHEDITKFRDLLGLNDTKPEDMPVSKDCYGHEETIDVLQDRLRLLLRRNARVAFDLANDSPKNELEFEE